MRATLLKFLDILEGLKYEYGVHVKRVKIGWNNYYVLWCYNNHGLKELYMDALFWGIEDILNAVEVDKNGRIK